jgi:hypothetical protein
MKLRARMTPEMTGSVKSWCRCRTGYRFDMHCPYNSKEPVGKPNP